MSEVFVKDLEFKLNSLDIHPNSEIKGTIAVSYPGRRKGQRTASGLQDNKKALPPQKPYNRQS